MYQSNGFLSLQTYIFPLNIVIIIKTISVPGGAVITSDRDGKWFTACGKWVAWRRRGKAATRYYTPGRLSKQSSLAAMEKFSESPRSYLPGPPF